MACPANWRPGQDVIVPAPVTYQAAEERARARAWILDQGGAANSNVFTRNLLALYGAIPWRGVPTPELDTFWRSIQSFLDGTPGRAIILGMQGYHDHWTVIDNISDRSIALYDSALIKRLPRSGCSTFGSNGRRKHQLLPAQTYYLSNNYAFAS